MQGNGTTMPTNKKARKVAVVNGSNELLGLFQAVLGSGRYEISFFESSEQAYSRIKYEQPSLIVLFMHIDDPADFHALSMLKLDSATYNIPILTYVAPCDIEQSDENARGFGGSSALARKPEARMN